MARKTYIRAGLIALMVAFVPTQELNAFGRDADGSRMQARAISLGSSARDTLSPPGDTVDWRYVRVSSAAVITVSVNSKPSSASARVALTDSVGRSLKRGTTKDGKLSLRRRVDPGIYYMSVSSDVKLSYSFSVR